MSSVLIVGAGLSGLNAARTIDKISNGDIKVTIIEARDRIGGLCYSRQDDKIGAIDLGGEYVGSTHKTLKTMAEGLGVQLFKAHEIGDIAIDTKAEGTYFTFDPAAKYNPFKILDRRHIMYKITTMSYNIPIESPWSAPKAEQWDHVTFDAFLQKEVWTNTIYSEIRAAMRCLCCCEINEMSLLAALWIIRRSGGIHNLCGMLNKPGLQKIVGGAQHFCDKVKESLNSSYKVILNELVVQVKDDPDKKDKVKVQTLGGKTYEADFLVLALPLKCVSKIQFEPPLPGMKKTFLEKVQNGCIIKTASFYNAPIWKDGGHCGEIISDVGPAQYVLDSTVPPGNFPSVTGYIVGGKAVAEMSSNRTTKDRDVELGKYYESVFEDERFIYPSHFLEKVWTEDQLSGGWGVFYPPGVLTNYGSVMREPCGRVHFASSELSPIWGGFMEGALLSGERTAKMLIEVMTKKSIHHIEKEDALARGILDLLGNESRPHFSGAISIKHMLLGTAAIVTLGTAGLLYANTEVSFSPGGLTARLNFGSSN